MALYTRPLDSILVSRTNANKLIGNIKHLQLLISSLSLRYQMTTTKLVGMANWKSPSTQVCINKLVVAKQELELEITVDSLDALTTNDTVQSHCRIQSCQEFPISAR